MDYLILRACERLDPRAVFGRPWNELDSVDQIALLGYDKLRIAEETDERVTLAQMSRGIR